MPGRNRWHDPQRGRRYTRFQSGDAKDVTSEVSSGSESVGQPTESSENPGTGTGAFKQLVEMGPQGRASPRPSLLLDWFLECPNSSQSPRVLAKSRSMPSLPRR